MSQLRTERRANVADSIRSMRQTFLLSMMGQSAEPSRPPSCINRRYATACRISRYHRTAWLRSARVCLKQLGPPENLARSTWFGEIGVEW